MCVVCTHTHTDICISKWFCFSSNSSSSIREKNWFKSLTRKANEKTKTKKIAIIKKKHIYTLHTHRANSTSDNNKWIKVVFYMCCDAILVAGTIWISTKLIYWIYIQFCGGSWKISNGETLRLPSGSGRYSSSVYMNKNNFGKLKSIRIDCLRARVNLIWIGFSFSVCFNFKCIQCGWYIIAKSTRITILCFIHSIEWQIIFFDLCEFQISIIFFFW